MRRFLLLILAGFLIIIGLLAEAGQARAADPVGELVAGQELVQTFRATQNDLQRLTFTPLTFGRANNCTLRVRLIEVTAMQTTLERYIPCQELQNNQPYSISFPPVVEAKGRQFRLIFSSPDGQPKNAISILTSSSNDLDGNLSLDGQVIAGNVSLELGYRYEGYVIRYQQSFLFALIFLVLLGLALLLRWGRWYLRANTTVSFGVYLGRRWPEIGLLLGVFVLYMLAIPYRQFADEYDNILGGVYINQGRLPNTDFFTHHMPMAYYVAAFITFFTKNEVWAFRAIFLFLLFLWSVGLYGLFRKYGNRAAGGFFLLFLGFSMLIFWGHMLMAETLIAYATANLVLLVTLKYSRGHVITRRDVLLVSALIATIGLNSLGYIFLVVFSYGFFGYLFVRQQLAKPPSAETVALRPRYLKNLQTFLKYNTPGLLEFVLIMAAPYLLLLGLLLASGGLERFIFENYDFNRYYYAQFNSDVQANSFDALLLLFKKVATGAETATRDVLNPTNYQPFFGLLAVVGLATGWLYRRNFTALAFFLSVVVLLNPRGGVGQSWNQNFHATPFIVVCLLAASLALTEIPAYLKDNRAPLLRGLYYLLAVYSLFVFIGAVSFSASTYYAYLTQEGVNLITAQPNDTARAVNDLATGDARVWIAPFDYDTLLFVEPRPATRYPFALPWVAVCDRCRREIIQELTTNKPKLIVWSPNQTIFSGLKMDRYAADILDYIKQNYFVVKNSKGGRLDNFYFLKEQQAPIMTELKAKGYLS